MSSIFNALFRSVSTSSGPVSVTTPFPPAIDKQSVGKQIDKTLPTTPSHPLADTAEEPRKRTVTQPNPSTVVKQAIASPLFGSTSSPDNSKENYPPTPFSQVLEDHSFDITTSTQSETDILLPRGVPYIHRRQLADAETHSTPINLSSFYQPSSIGRGKPITIRDPLSPHPEVEQKAALQLTEWRKEQLRRQNPPRLMEPVVLRSITALHGPPNLPYARNPSGVDSSIPDEAAYHPQIPDPSSNQPKSAPSDTVNQPRHSDIFQLKREPTPQAMSGAPQRYLRPVDRVPYQQHIDMAHIPPITAHTTRAPVGPSPSSAIALAGKLTPSEMLRLQISTNPIIRPLESIAESTLPPITRTLAITRKRSTSISMPAEAAVAAQKIAEDVESYPTAPRYVHPTTSDGSRVTSTGSQASAAASMTLAEDEAAAKALANSKADASVNWRLKTPARSTTSTLAKQAHESKNMPALDRSDDSPVMTIDSLFEKFAPSIGLNPVTFRVNAPTPDPAVKDISQTPFNTTFLLRSSTGLPVVSLPATPERASLTSESIVEDLINLTTDLDEISDPTKRKYSPRTTTSRSKGTPEAGKLLRRTSGGQGKKAAASPAATPPAKVKTPLGPARTVSGAASKGKARAA